MKKKNILVTMLCCVLVSALTLGATLAYLTATTPTLNNVFTIGGFNMPDPDPGSEDNDIQLTEPNWSTTDTNKNDVPDAAENLEPGQTVAKDPKVTNRSTTLDAYVFLKVVMPLNADNQELFTLLTSAGTNNAENGINVNSGWVEITPSNTPNEDGGKVHIFAWGNNTAMTVLDMSGKAGGNNVTATLFDSVRLNNLTKLPAAGQNQTIKITAYAIQTTLVNDDGTEMSTAPTTVWPLVAPQAASQTTLQEP